jgi:hypothetical protein
MKAYLTTCLLWMELTVRIILVITMKSGFTFFFFFDSFLSIFDFHSIYYLKSHLFKFKSHSFDLAIFKFGSFFLSINC